MSNFFSQQLLLIVLSLLIVSALGLIFKFHQGFAQDWVNNYGAAIFYEIFWCLLIFGFVPTRKNISRIPIWVFVITCLLEILQLWHPLFLEVIRATFIGRLLLGTTFSWMDFPHYFLGSLLGWLWLRKIWQLSVKTLLT